MSETPKYIRNEVADAIKDSGVLHLPKWGVQVGIGLVALLIPWVSWVTLNTITTSSRFEDHVNVQEIRLQRLEDRLDNLTLQLRKSKQQIESSAADIKDLRSRLKLKNILGGE